MHRFKEGKLRGGGVMGETGCGMCEYQFQDTFLYLADLLASGMKFQMLSTASQIFDVDRMGLADVLW